jgi:hypothetical protein
LWLIAKSQQRCNDDKNTAEHDPKTAVSGAAGFTAFF